MFSRLPARLALAALALAASACADGGASSGNGMVETPALTCPEVVDPTRCAPDARFRIHVKLDFAVEDGLVWVVTQSGPYSLPAETLDGKTFVYLFMPKGEVFQGDLREALSIGAGTMHGTSGELTTEAVFPAGEYEFLTFIDTNPGPQPITGPDRGDLAAFDNGVCDPTGVSVRIAVPCADGEATLENRQFIIF
jgi:hypothetical protein